MELDRQSIDLVSQDIEAEEVFKHWLVLFCFFFFLKQVGLSFHGENINFLIMCLDAVIVSG